VGRVAGIVLAPVPEPVRAQTSLKKGQGVLIVELDRNAVQGKPDLAPLELHDIITHVDDLTVTSPESLVKALNALEPGQVFQYRLLRGGMTRIVPAKK
jgi:S1-C subfamily serine protease